MVKKRNILIVDDDEKILETLKKELIEDSKKYDIEFARNGKEALEMMEGKEFDLLITDIRMPVMDGISLLMEILNRKKWMHVIVASGESTMRMMNLKNMEELKDFGIITHIFKPYIPSSFRKLLRETMEKIEKSDVIQGITLPSILQMVEMDGVTGVVSVQKGKHKGRLFFRGGRLIDAQTADKEGKEAALEILSWKDVKVHIEYIPHNRKRNIKSSLVSIVLEASKRSDEEEIS